MTFGLSASALQQLTKLVGSRPAVWQAILFGSRAKGNFKPGSDIDIALVGPQLTQDDILAITSAFNDTNLPYTLDLINLHMVDNPELLDHIQRVGKLIFKKSNDK